MRQSAAFLAISPSTVVQVPAGRVQAPSLWASSAVWMFGSSRNTG